MQDIIVERNEQGLEITINRPDKLNAIREQTAVEILEQIELAEADRSCRAILIKGLEKAFCTGTCWARTKPMRSASGSSARSASASSLPVKWSRAGVFVAMCRS